MILKTSYKGRAMNIRAYGEHWAARLIGRSFSLWLVHCYQHALKNTRRKTVGHELGHTGDVQDFADKVRSWLYGFGRFFLWLVLPIWLIGYFGKRLLRRICYAIEKPQWAPRDIHESHAESGAQAIVDGKHPDWHVTDEAWENFP